MLLLGLHTDFKSSCHQVLNKVLHIYMHTYIHIYILKGDDHASSRKKDNAFEPIGPIVYIAIGIKVWFDAKAAYFSSLCAEACSAAHYQQ